jgi:hypothetical protein
MSRASSDFGSKLGGHLPQLRCDPAERLPLVGVGSKSSDQVAIFRIHQQFFEFSFQVFHPNSQVPCKLTISERLNHRENLF